MSGRLRGPGRAGHTPNSILRLRRFDLKLVFFYPPVFLHVCGVLVVKYTYIQIIYNLIQYICVYIYMYIIFFSLKKLPPLFSQLVSFLLSGRLEALPRTLQGETLMMVI